MAYQKQNWIDYPDVSTPITADRLNHMEDGIEEAYEHGGGAGENLKIGTIIPYTGSDSDLPDGYLLCDGSEISRETYSDLFTVIGTTYGEGDGTSTFNIPNLKGKIPVGLDSQDEDFDALGKTGGEKEHTLTVAEMPAHTHNNSPTARSTSVNAGTASSVSVNDNTGVSAPYQTGSRGGSEPHNILQPYVVINYIIKALQTTPVAAEVENDYSESTENVYSCDYINKVDSYSTTEVKTNKKWIDGKPIYRKVIYISVLPNNTQLSYDSGITETLDHVFIKEDNSYYTWTSDNDYSLRQNITTIYYAKQTNKIFIATNTNLSDWHMYLTLEYTKTTD